jgi:His/Glu/Gln/Arg/opine family amino acid ABC transporter permease subunit
LDFELSIISHNIHYLLSGLQITILVVATSLVSGLAIGFVACLGSLRRKGLIYRAARSYIDFFRTVPEAVLIFWAYFCLPPILDIRLPALSAGILSLALIAGAYLAEIMRAGVEVVPRDQWDAGHSLGLSRYHLWRLIVIPQALRRMAPALVNFVSDLLKTSTLLAAIGVQELAYSAYTLGATTYRYFETLTAVAAIFFLIILAISTCARLIEHRLLRATGV